MFLDLHSDLGSSAVRALVAGSAWDKSEAATDRTIAQFRDRDDWHLYGWVENGEVVGTCGAEVHEDFVVIKGIAVDPNTRMRGVGKAMITALQQKYMMRIEAETDDGAVGFYRKCGFEAEGFMKTYPSGEVRRYRCILQYI